VTLKDTAAVSLRDFHKRWRRGVGKDDWSLRGARGWNASRICKSPALKGRIGKKEDPFEANTYRE